MTRGLLDFIMYFVENNLEELNKDEKTAAVKPDKKRMVLGVLKQYAIITLGCIIYSIGIAMFVDPADLSAGGMTGISIIISKIPGVPLDNGSTLYAPSVSFYYDVPLDSNYSIESSLAKVRTFLKENGFKLNARGHWVKEGTNIVIDVEDNELDLYIHVRKSVEGERA